ncbi:MAG: hypothetical protein GXO57_03900 [Thermodesulfobacteria bacterium]|nr:hypothetical protein [Thermodesulfobacteriota bacterium]
MTSVRIDLIKRSYLNYKKLLLKEKGPFLLEKKSEPEEGDIRVFGVFPPVYLLIAEKLSRLPDIFKVIPLSEEVKLSYLNKTTPMFIFSALPLCLCALPLEFYAERALLFNYSKKIGSTCKNSIYKCKSYALNTIIPKYSYQGKFIALERERLLKYGLKLDKNHLIKEQVLILPEEVKAEIKESYEFFMSATPKSLFKGKNFYGIVEPQDRTSAKLTVYLPETYKGREVEIKIGNFVVFKGVLYAEKLVIKNFPLFYDYSFLEEALSVQVRKL